VSLVVASAVSQEVGAALAVGLFAGLGALGAVAMRFLIAAAILVAAVRPRVRGLSRDRWVSAAGLGCALALMNFCFYQAIARIPLGVAVTIEICGPLILSVLLSRHRSAWLWAACAFVAVALLSLHRGSGHAAVSGFAFAAGAAVGWALYVVASARAAIRFPRLDALAIATCVGALLLVPLASATTDLHNLEHLPVLGMAAVVAVLSSVAPYSLELISLRTLPAGTFAVLTSASPIVAALAGAVVLDQRLVWSDWVAVVLVTFASAGAVRDAGSRAQPCIT
jgi:inner membrane transporter RhtA